MHEHATELQDRFADSALCLLMDQYAQEDGDFLLQEYQNSGSSFMPHLLEQQCRKTIRKAYHSAVIGSTLKRAARWVACGLVLFTCLFSLAMRVEAFRIPVINYILKHGKGFTQITFTQDSQSFDSADHLIMMIHNAIPDGYYLNAEHLNTSSYMGVERVSSLLMHYEHNNGSAFQITIMEAMGSLNIDSQEAAVTEMDLHGQQAILVESDSELRVLWVNDKQKLLYSVTAYQTQPNVFWACVNSLSEAVQLTENQITF